MPPLRRTGTGPEAEHPEYAGQYRLESVLGSGGMGVVHLATSASGLRLAVKVVHADFAADPEFRARFRQEVAAARRVSGAFTAPVVDADTDAERPWMATLFIEGPTLAERVKRNGPLGTEELLRLGAGLAESLRDIHRAGVVHRDLKPSNVLLAADGPKVIDFGISRPSDSDLRTETGKLIGTPPFMAPEQFQRPREVGPAADVFAMGSVLVHAATGSGPFDSDSPYIVAYQVVHDEPDLTGVPEALAPLFARCLAKDPDDRPTPDGLMMALRSAAYRTGDDTQAFIPAQRTPSRVEGAVRGQASGPVQRSEVEAEPQPGSPIRIRRRVVRRAVLAVALASLVVGGAFGVRALTADDGRHPAPSPAAQQSGTGEGSRPWHVSLQGGGDGASSAASCSYADSSLYCNAPGISASRLNAADGTVAWSKKTGAGSEPAWDDTAPVLSGGLLHVVAPGGERLEALDPKSGDRRWSVDASAHPVVLHTRKSVLLVSPDGTVEAVNSATGKTRWTRRHGVPGTQWMSPSPGHEGPVFAVTPSADGTASTVVAVDPDNGSALWTQRLNGMLTPVAASDGALFLLSYDTASLTRAVVRLDTTARTARRIPLLAPVDQAQAAVRGDTAYIFGAGGSLVAVDTRRTASAQQAQQWRLETSVSHASRPVATAGRVYLTAADGRLLAVDAADGRLLGQTRPRMAEAPDTFATTLPAPTAAAGKVFATAPDGSVFAVDDGDPARW
ncbi:PQQ-binding-like beta-propeller repeat protein [Streptomyces sp. ISL-98]|uniref:serine/threonine-protein kinase n=1 Tax=Streptomyces sp. ISL-98 TaxID=2819192 RepID=UPI001BE829A6|nr:serine/threonine-protein kinase [Streptomyces sp. ISL-98]MBT2506799.1 PQQ-binding-like beta-propeller repeat protein [Streptomyces sp. ISL-98]